MKKLFNFGCLKTHTTDDGLLLSTPAVRYQNRQATSSNWNTPPLARGAMQRGLLYQASPAKPIPADQLKDGATVDSTQELDNQSLQMMAKQGADELDMLRNSQRILKAKSRVLELICKDIRDRYKALDLPPDMPLPPSTAPEGETLAAMTARADPDTRRIVEAGQKVLAMLAAISQLSREALQEQDKVRSDLFTSQAARTRAESKSAQARHLSDARAQALHKVNLKLKDLEVQNKGLKDALAKALRESGTEMVPDVLFGADDTPCQSLNPMQQRMLSDCLKENKAPEETPDSGAEPLKDTWSNRGHDMSSSLSGEKLKALLHDKQSRGEIVSLSNDPAAKAHDRLAGQAEASTVSFRQPAGAPETTGKLAGHAADIAALSTHTSSPLRPALRPPVAVQRSPSRHHRRQLSTVTEEVVVKDAAVPDTDAKPNLPMLDLQALTQQQVAYTGPQELYQSTAYTSETTGARTSATVSNFSETAANQSNAFASQQQQQSRQLDDDAESQATDTPPLINFTPPPRQAVAKLAKVFQPGPSRLSNSSNDVTASKAWSPLKHHARGRQETAAGDAADGSRLAVGSGPRESHLDFFLRDAAAATANFRTSQGPGVGPLQNHIHISAADQGFFGAYDAAVWHPPQASDAYVRDRAHSTVSSHSNPLFSTGPEDRKAQQDIQSGAEHQERASLDSQPSSAGRAQEDPKVKQSVVASTATRLTDQATPQAQNGPAASGTAPQGDWDSNDVQHPSREKTPDTNVKLNQPLRCGRYGQDLIAHKQKRAAQQAGQQPSRLPRLAPKTQQQPSDATNRHAALVASRHSTSAAHVTIPQHAPGLAAATAVAAANPAADNPAGQQAKRNGNPAAALVTSADDLLTGQLAAATAASTALPKAPKATMPHSKTDSATLKQDFLQHLATRPVARACVSGRSSVDDLMMAAASSSAQETSAEAAAVAPVGSSQTTSGLVGTNRPRSVQHRIHVTQQQVMQHRGVMFHDGTDCENTPLRMQYSTSGSSGTRSSTSSWQTTSTVSAMQYCSGGLASQYSSAQLPYTTAEQSPLQLQGMPQQALRQIHSDGADAEGMRHAQQHQQPDFADDQGILEGGGACEEEVLRQSNDKLDMLLQSAVKQSRQALPGKENRSKQVHTRLKQTGRAGARTSKAARESTKALRDYKH